MISSTCCLLAQAATTTEFEFGRIQSNYDWWVYAGILLAILAPLVWLYRRDTSELPWYLRMGLPLLRTLVLIGLLVVYLQPRWRSQREEHLDSRVLMLVDTSLSMGLDTAGGKTGTPRLQQVAAALDDTEFLARLRKKHHVTVVPFNSVLEKDRRVVLPMEVKTSGEAGDSDTGNVSGTLRVPSGRRHTECAGYIARLAQAPRARRHRYPPGRGPQTTLAGGAEHAGFRGRAGERRRPERRRVARRCAGARPRVAHPHLHRRRRLGKEASRCPCGRIQRSLPGLSRRSLRGGRFDPGLRHEGANGAGGAFGPAKARTPRILPAAARAGVVDSAEKILLGDGEAVPVKFELPPSEVGHRVLCLRVKAPPGSSGTMYSWSASDNYLEGAVDVSDHQTHVLLLAGGPCRDYQYLRTLLFRDKSMKLDVLLQSGQPGMSQEATNLLDDFPATRQEMADYDCIVAFDPDWKALRPEQVDLLFEWVDQDHGGMVVIAGPVNAGRTAEGWVQDRGHGQDPPAVPG